MAQILLIEPDHVLANTYRDALVVNQHSVIMCTSAQSAISAADTNQPDLVILELQLIEHSGIEFLYEFRSYPEWRDIPVIVLSTVPPIEFGNSRNILCNELGIHVYHYKPHTTLRGLLSSVNSLSSVSA